MTLRLRFYRGWDGVEGAVQSVVDRLPDGSPRPRIEGPVLLVPLYPETVDMLCEELEARGLKFLAARVSDPVRWRER